MKIRAVDVFEVAYPLITPFVISGGKVASTMDSTVVRLETDTGLVGWGEQCSFTPNYLVGHGAGARAAMPLLAAAVIGSDPRQVDVTYARMDAAMMGHAYAKSAIDIAAWDLFGQDTGLSIADLAGGRRHDEVPLYAGVGVGEPERMGSAYSELIAQGYRRVQIKVGTDWRSDVARVEACLAASSAATYVSVDSNGYHSLHEAVQLVAALDDLDVTIEQPCGTISQCAAVRRGSSRPFVLDESLSTIEHVLEAWHLGAMDAATLKLSRFGGITPLLRARDLCVSLGIAVTLEDSGGGDIVSAACMQLAASVAPRMLHGAYLPSTLVGSAIARDAPHASNGIASIPLGPGLGITVDPAALGPACLHVE